MSLRSIDPSRSAAPRRISDDDAGAPANVAVLAPPIAPVLASLRSRAYTRKVESVDTGHVQLSNAAVPAAVSYQHALRAFQAGRGTLVRSDEQRHVALLVPRIEGAPNIGVPVPNASKRGLVGAQEMTATPMMGRHGPIESSGLLFWSGISADEGSWQPVMADGTGVIIFSNATDEQAAAMQDKLASLSNGDASLSTIDALLGYARSLGIRDCYKSTREAIGDRERFEVSAPGTAAQGGAALVRLIRKPALTRALFVPPGSPLAWDMHGTPTSNVILQGGMIIVSRQDPLELRHIEPRDAETYYRIADTGERIHVSSTAQANVERLSAPQPRPAPAPLVDRTGQRVGIRRTLDRLRNRAAQHRR